MLSSSNSATDMHRIDMQGGHIDFCRANCAGYWRYLLPNGACSKSDACCTRALLILMSCILQQITTTPNGLRKLKCNKISSRENRLVSAVITKQRVGLKHRPEACILSIAAVVLIRQPMHSQSLALSCCEVAYGLRWHCRLIHSCRNESFCLALHSCPG